MSFHDVSFTPRLPFGLTVASRRDVDVVALASGHEARNARTARPLRRFSIPVGPRPIAEIRAILSFFEARGGPLHAFRFRDPIDHATHGEGAPTALDVAVGTGDGFRSAFQLLAPDGRRITKPDAASVLVSVDGAPLDAPSFAVDPLAGVITIDPPPRAGAMIRAGCFYDLPVRFESTALTVTRATPQTGEMEDLSLVEVRA